MKLREGAVLLIIGAATVGPIEPKSIEDPSLGHMTVPDCISRVQGYGNREQLEKKCRKSPTAVFGTYLYRPETTAETCSRVMGEVGAWKVLRFGPSKENPNGLITAEWLVGGEERSGELLESWWAVLPEGMREKEYTTMESGIQILGYWDDKYRATCIPAPTGLRQ